MHNYHWFDGTVTDDGNVISIEDERGNQAETALDLSRRFEWITG